MSLKIILTLVIAFLLALFGIFNTEFIEFSFFGVSNVFMPISLFVFAIFMAGGIYAGILSFSVELRNKAIIRNLKKTIKKLKKSGVHEDPEEEREETAEETLPTENEYNRVKQKKKHKKNRSGHDEEEDLKRAVAEDLKKHGSVISEEEHRVREDAPVQDKHAKLTPEERRIALMKIMEEEKNQGDSASQKIAPAPDKKKE